MEDNSLWAGKGLSQGQQAVSCHGTRKAQELKTPAIFENGGACGAESRNIDKTDLQILSLR